MIRRFRYALFGVGVIALSGCAPLSSLPAASFAPSSYAALGASDAVGLGATVPCVASMPIPLGAPADPACPGGTGYVPEVARRLANPGRPIALTDLGISGAVIGPEIKALGNRYGTLSADECRPRGSGGDAIPADILTDEVPKLPSKAAYVTVFAGANDVIALAGALGCGAGGTTESSEQAFVASEAAAFASDYASVFAAVKRADPAARIVVANLPDLAAVPLGLTKPTTARQTLRRLSLAFDSAIDRLSAEGIAVVDVLCDPRSYIATNYSADGFHPNDAGYSVLASLMEPLLVSGATRSLSPNCAQAALAQSEFP